MKTASPKKSDIASIGLQLSAAVFVVMFAIIGSWYIPHLQTSQDVGVYQRIGKNVFQARANSEISVQSEYPPFATALFSVAAHNPLSASFAHSWLYIMIFLVVVLLWFARKYISLSDISAMSCSIFLTAVLLGPELVYARYDIFIGLLLLLSWRMMAHVQYAKSGFFYAWACCLKIVPIVLLPFLVSKVPQEDRRQWWQGALFGFISSIGIAALLLGIKGFNENIEYLSRYHSGRGVQIETTLSSFHLLWKNAVLLKTDVVFRAMSAENNLLQHWSVWLAGLVCIGLAIFTVLCAKRKHCTVGSGSICILLWTLGASSVLSPQYFVWVMPLLFFWLLEKWSNKRSADLQYWCIWFLAIFLCLATQWIFPSHYSSLLDQSSFFIIVLLALRNLAIFALLFFVYRYPQSFTFSFYNVLRNTHVRVGLWFVLAATFLVHTFSMPSIGEARYMNSTGAERMFTMPFSIPAETKEFYVNVPIHTGVLPVILYHVNPDDCINGLHVNGKKVPFNRMCEYADGVPLPVGNVLAKGSNQVMFSMEDEGGYVGLDVYPSNRDPILFLLRCFMAASVVLLGISYVVNGSKKQHIMYLVLLLCMAVFLRIAYVMGTPYEVRSHDTGAHIQYIQYVVEHNAIPHAKDGWEFHQPPLYYFVAAAFTRVGLALNHSMKSAIAALQFWSLFAACISVLLVAFTGFSLFSWKDESKKILFYIAIVGTIPAFIFTASRITNDVLYTALACVFFWVLLLWWKQNKPQLWYVLILIVSLAFLTKLTALLLIAVLVACLLMLPHWSYGQKIKHGVCGLILLMSLTFWLPIVRMNEPDTTKSMTLGNHGMSSALAVENTVKNWLTFNPVQILKVPYNNPWSSDNRRDYFLEYFFRSFFTGEFGFAERFHLLNMLILLFATGVLLVGGVGLYRTVRYRWLEDWPVLMIFGALLGGAVLYRFFFAYAANQDARFSILLVAPIAYFVVRGCFSGTRMWQQASQVFVIGMCSLSALFIMLLHFT